MSSRIIKEARIPRRGPSRLKSGQIPSENGPLVVENWSDNQTNLLVNAVNLHRESYFPLKNEEKTNETPPVQPPTIAPLLIKTRRSTKPSCNYALRQSQVYDGIEMNTPDDHPESLCQKELDITTSKKPTSYQSIQFSQPADDSFKDLKPQPKRIDLIKSDSFLSPYHQKRKSYRKNTRRGLVSIPYRKCHDIFEGRIVSILNKLYTDKSCVKDLESLVQKMQRISVKDLMNRYVISGIHVLLRVAHQKQSCDTALLKRLDQEEKNLIQRVYQELDHDEDYQQLYLSEQNPVIDREQYRIVIMRKLQRILRNMQPRETRHQLRQKAYQLADTLFMQECKATTIIKIIRDLVKSQHTDISQ